MTAGQDRGLVPAMEIAAAGDKQTAPLCCFHIIFYNIAAVIGRKNFKTLREWGFKYRQHVPFAFQTAKPKSFTKYEAKQKPKENRCIFP